MSRQPTSPGSGTWEFPTAGTEECGRALRGAIRVSLSATATAGRAVHWACAVRARGPFSRFRPSEAAFTLMASGLCSSSWCVVPDFSVLGQCCPLEGPGSWDGEEVCYFLPLALTWPNSPACGALLPAPIHPLVQRLFSP